VLGKKFKVFWDLSRGHRATYLIAIVSMAIGYVLMFGVPLIAKFSIDAILAEGTVSIPDWLYWLATLISADSGPDMLDYLLLAAIAIVLLTAGSGSLLYVRGRCAAVASEGIVQILREKVFHHLEHLPADFHDKADTGDLVQRCTSDVETFRVFVAAQVIEISRAILLLLTVLPILFSLDVAMAFLSLASMPVLFIFAILFFLKVKVLFKSVDEAEAELTTVLQENLTGIRVVRAFAQQQTESDKFAVRNADFRDKNMHLMQLLGLYFSLSDLICMTQLGALLIVGANWVQTGDLSIGTLFAFLTYEGMVIWPIRHMGRVLTDTGKAVVSVQRLSEILLVPEETQHEVELQHRLKGAIYMSGVGFAFDAGNPVLEDISLHLNPGEVLAILGPPGSGKSTLVQLLLRLYDYQQGTIQLDGEELSSLNRKYIRSQISTVLQEPFLYSASIGDNVRVGNINAEDLEVKEATQAACIHDSISGFAGGYNSMVGERGVTLSGGQRQRIALARALLKDPPILILDDALSAVDTDTEAKILNALHNRKGRHTTIIIAHRLSTVLAADKILVLNHGRIIQSGNHESLMAEDGMYQKLCQIQGNLETGIASDIVLSNRRVNKV
jgi:ATP-binding cassette subfamily B protein